MLKILLIPVVLLAIGNLYPIIKILILVIKYGSKGQIIFPKIGLVVSAHGLLFLHILLEIILLAIAVLLFWFN
jgi:hypothetical protein